MSDRSEKKSTKSSPNSPENTPKITKTDKKPPTSPSSPTSTKLETKTASQPTTSDVKVEKKSSSTPTRVAKSKKSEEEVVKEIRTITNIPWKKKDLDRQKEILRAKLLNLIDEELNNCSDNAEVAVACNKIIDTTNSALAVSLTRTRYEALILNNLNHFTENYCIKSTPLFDDKNFIWEVETYALKLHDSYRQVKENILSFRRWLANNFASILRKTFIHLNEEKFINLSQDDFFNLTIKGGTAADVRGKLIVSLLIIACTEIEKPFKYYIFKDLHSTNFPDDGAFFDKENNFVGIEIKTSVSNCYQSADFEPDWPRVFTMFCIKFKKSAKPTSFEELVSSLCKFWIIPYQLLKEMEMPLKKSFSLSPKKYEEYLSKLGDNHEYLLLHDFSLPNINIPTLMYDCIRKVDSYLNKDFSYFVTYPKY